MTEAQGRTLPPPAKPKRKGHEPPTAAEPAVSNGAAPAAGRRHETTPAPELAPPLTTEAREPVPAASGGPEAPGSRTTVYSDTRIDDFLQEVKIHAAMARLDLTASAVWRRAMHDLMHRTTPAQLVHEFDTVPTEEPKPGRPRR